MERHGAAPDGHAVEFALVRPGLGEHRVEIATLLDAWTNRKKQTNKKQIKRHERRIVGRGTFASFTHRTCRRAARRTADTRHLAKRANKKENVKKEKHFGNAFNAQNRPMRQTRA